MAKTYEAMQKSHELSQSGWHFLDIQNKKQIGYLEKTILNLNQNKGMKVFNFTSSRSGEGVTTILINLLNYFKFQKSGKRVLAIDAHLQSPSFHAVFQLDENRGLTDLISESLPLSEAIQTVAPGSLDVVASGEGHSKMSGELAPGKIVSLVDEAKALYDYIFIDSAPILSSSDALATALAADATFLVIQSLKVQRDVARRAKILLDNNECHIAGVLLNRNGQVIPEWIYRIV